MSVSAESDLDGEPGKFLLTRGGKESRKLQIGLIFRSVQRLMEKLFRLEFFFEAVLEAERTPNWKSC